MGVPSPVTSRLRQLRQRHFGPRGKRDFASRLGVSIEEYERYERGAVPPPEFLLRACELTGEDLQWLLTGVASRGTMIISGARPRHQDLVARLARLLDQNPQSARAIDAFMNLLEQSRGSPPPAGRLLSADADLRIPLFRASHAPRSLSAPLTLACLDESKGHAARLPACSNATLQPFGLAAPVPSDDVRVFEAPSSDPAAPSRWIIAPPVSDLFSAIFAVEVQESVMSPLLEVGDGAVVSPDAPPELGAPVLCHVGDPSGPRCRIWLGCQDGTAHLGRLTDQEREAVPLGAVLWSLKVLFRLRLAA